jgi:crossover junction endodeoxyribonuclease RuvC
VIVLGVDPGTQRTGYAFLELRREGALHPGHPAANQGRIRVLEYGVIRNPSGDPLPQRLEKIHRELRHLMETYHPACLALENIFFAKYPQSALILGHARGAIMVAAQAMGVPVAEYAPSLVKRATVGTGSASKERVAALIQSHLGLKKPPTPADAADALAIAFCHLMQGKASVGGRS